MQVLMVFALALSIIFPAHCFCQPNNAGAITEVSVTDSVNFPGSTCETPLAENASIPFAYSPAIQELPLDEFIVDVIIALDCLYAIYMVIYYEYLPMIYGQCFAQTLYDTCSDCCYTLKPSCPCIDCFPEHFLSCEAEYIWKILHLLELYQQCIGGSLEWNY